MMKAIIHVTHEPKFSYVVKDDCIAPDDAEILGKACMGWFSAEMSDSYSVTLAEQSMINERIKPIIAKYEHLGIVWHEGSVFRRED